MRLKQSWKCDGREGLSRSRFGLAGSLAQNIHLLADFLSDAGIGEIVDDLIAQFQRFGPLVLFDGGGKTRAEILAFVFKDVACHLLHGFDLGGRQIEIERLQNLDAAVHVVAIDRILPAFAKLFFAHLTTGFDLFGQSLDVRVIRDTDP